MKLLQENIRKIIYNLETVFLKMPQNLKVIKEKINRSKLKKKRFYMINIHTQ